MANRTSKTLSWNCSLVSICFAACCFSLLAVEWAIMQDLLTNCTFVGLGLIISYLNLKIEQVFSLRLCNKSRNQRDSDILRQYCGERCEESSKHIGHNAKRCRWTTNWIQWFASEILTAKKLKGMLTFQRNSNLSEHLNEFHLSVCRVICMEKLVV